MPVLREKIQGFLVNNLSSEQVRYTSERFCPDFHMKKYAGLSRGMAVTKKEAARAVIDFLEDEDRILDYVSYVLNLDGLGAGSSGRVRLRDTAHFFTDIGNMGWIYNKKHNRFERDQSRVKTCDWGILRSGSPYRLSFLNVDIVRSTDFSKHLDIRVLGDLFRDYRSFAQDLIHKFSGRIWEWNGDGFTAAFYGENDVLNAFRAACDFHRRVVLFQFRFGRLSPKTPILLRIGGDYGEILFKRENPVGDQIHPRNAGRLQGEFCPTGQFAVSGSFHKQLPPEYQAFFVPTDKTIEFEPVFLLGS